jgi:SpoVK/Ycf46/Vps4 family AAA+-type ATPase
MFIAAQEEEKDTRGPSTITKKMRDYKTERILLLGRSGTGKTYAATKYVL